MNREAGGTWAASSVPAYRPLFLSATIVIFGVMGQAVARGWLAPVLTGSNGGLGGVMLVFGASMLVATPLGSVAADRYPKRIEASTVTPDQLVGSACRNARRPSGHLTIEVTRRARRATRHRRI